MNLLAPAWLSLLLLLVPVLLLHARRQRRLEVPSLRLWKLVTPEPQRGRRWRLPQPSLLLFLQVATIVLAALALAQPRLSGEATAGHTIFLLDVSASMRAGDAAASRFESAVADLNRRIETAGETGSRISLITLGAEAALVLARQTDLAAMRPVLDRLRATDGTADLEGAQDWIDAVVRPDETTRLVLLTDASATPPELRATPFAVDTVSFGDPGTANAGLVASVAELGDGSGRFRVQGRVLLAGDAPPPDGVSVRFAPEGDEKGLDWGKISLSGEGRDEADGLRAIPFVAELSFPGGGHLQLSIGADAGPHDNSLDFVIGAGPRALRVLLVGREDPKVVRAVAALGNVELARAGALPEAEAGFDLVIAHDVALPRPPATNLLMLGRAAIAGEPEPGQLTAGYVSAWDPSHVLVQDVDWRSLLAPRFYPVGPLAGARVILEAGGMPLIQAREFAHGREVRVAMDPELSGWTDEPAFPVFLSRMIEWLGIEHGAAVPEPCIAGRPCRLEAREVAARIVAPSGEIVSGGWLSADVGALSRTREAFTPARAGLYRIERDGSSRAVAVRPADGETDLRVPGEPERPGAPEAPVWPWIIVGVLGLLLAEAWIAGRGAERFLVPAALRRSAPQARRRRLALGLRLATVVLLAGSLVRLPLPWPRPDRAAVVIVDVRMAAVDGQDVAQPVVADIRRSGSGLVLAGARPRVLADIRSETGTVGPLPLLDARPDLGRAMRLALALLPGDRPGSIVAAVQSDRQAGELAASPGELLGRGVALNWVPAGRDGERDILVDSVSVPRRAFLGDTFPLDAFVYSPVAAPASLTVLRDGVVAQTESVELAAGFNRIETVLSADTPGPALIEVAVSAAGDAGGGNNRDGAIIEVTGPPSVLVIASDEKEGEQLRAALALQDLRGTVVPPRGAPRALPDWLRHDLIVLMNVPALELGIDRLHLLSEAVRVHGRGLLILGGEKAFGPGGYYQSPLEDLSPLSSRVPHEAPVASVVFVLDRSGSMQAQVGDVTRLDIAKAATLKAAELLHEESRVGIVAFDSESHEVLPLLDRRDLTAVATALDPVQPGGGTMLFDALQHAIGMLETAETEVRHIIVMTDGLIEPVDFSELLVRAQEAGVTVSGIAFATSNITDLLASIADRGGGAYHRTSDFRALPSILAQETLTMAGPPLKTGESPVAWVDREAAFLSNLPAELPPVQNYVTTTAKPEADLHLSLTDGNGEAVPLLASWRQGSGRVLALATHGVGSGTGQWQAMREFPLLWAQIARHFLPATLGPGLHVDLHRSGDRIGVTATLLDEAARPVGGQEVTVVAADAGGRAIELGETAPGRYTGQIMLTRDGTSDFVVSAAGAKTTVSVHSGYPAGLNFSRPGAGELQTVAAATGGAALGRIGDLAAPGAVWIWAPAWRPWVLLALVVFVADLILRRRASRAPSAARQGMNGARTGRAQQREE
jgi:Mg-chelatase subunit ChlD